MYADVEVESEQHRLFHGQNLLMLEVTLANVDIIFHGGGIDFFVFSCDEKGSDRN